MQQLANVATSDAYTVAATLGPLATAQQLVYVVANASAYMQLAPSNQSGTAEDWLPEILVPPTSNVIARVTGARWRSAVAGSPAQIVAQLIQPDDPAPGAGTPFTGTLSAAGAFGSGVQIPAVPLAQFPPASPQDQQVVVLILPSTFDPIGGKPVRWLCQYDLSNALWHVLGGPPLVARVMTSEATASAAYVDLATVGPSLTIPRAGDYGISVENKADSGTQQMMSPSIAGATPVDIEASVGSSINTVFPLGYNEFIRTGLATSATVIAKYRATDGVSRAFSQRYLKIWPERIT